MAGAAAVSSYGGYVVQDMDEEGVVATQVIGPGEYGASMVLARWAGPWRGPATAEWVARIAAPSLREGESLPWVKGADNRGR